MPNPDPIKNLVEMVERERIEAEVVRRAGADASGFLAHRSLFPLTNVLAMVVLGTCSALVALILNFVIVVLVFHISLE